ncbi:DUF222 domain-containing protein [Blastococcus montanus]|uniref:DUF222 domain-containing protein n=1 Tax=Blastococcus montanus TaxID=3144973 RepID=UPI003209C1AA
MIDGRQQTGEQPAAPAAGWASDPLGAVQAADREIARQTALRARAGAEFAATRPASADRQPGEPGAMGEERRAARADVLADVSEWAVQELAVALSISSQAAQTLLIRSLTLVHRLPRTLAALESGALHVGHLWPLLEKVAPIVNATVRARVEADLLAWAAGRVTTPAQLGAKARRMVLARDARDAAGRLTARLRERGVFVRPDAADGMAVLHALLTVPEAQALVDALGRYADALADDPDDRRTRGQKMADCLLDCVLRPGETDLPPVQAQLTVVAGVSTLAGGDEPGEIGGEPVPAEMVRALARALGLLPGVAAPPDDLDSIADPVADAPPAARHADALSSPAAPPATDPVTAEDRALEEWWAAVEERVLAEGWGGAEAPPPEEQLRLWNEEAAWQERYWDDLDRDDHGWDVEPSTGTDPDRIPDDRDEGRGDEQPHAAPTSDRAPVGGPWAVADRAVESAGAVLLDLERALGAAGRAVAAAEAADLADEAAWRQGPGGRFTAAPDALTALAAMADEQRATLADLLDATAGGTLVDRPRIAVVDALSGALLALTDSRELRRVATCGRDACRCRPGRCTHDLSGRPGLGPPPPTAGYRPGASLDRYLRARDRRCRFPGCRARVPRGGELDHDRPWPDGPTSAANLAGYCTPHHRGKHQAPGWQYELAADGTLTVTTPTGLVACTSPPPY